MKHERTKPEPMLARRFVPRFWENADQRLAIVKQIRDRYEDLKIDAGAESIQKDMLAQRAVFLAVWLETQERDAIESGRFDPGPYIQAVNGLNGLLRSLGLDKKAKKVPNLRAYVEAAK